jgi:hypothetical protein
MKTCEPSETHLFFVKENKTNPDGTTDVAATASVPGGTPAAASVPPPFLIPLTAEEQAAMSRAHGYAGTAYLMVVPVVPGTDVLAAIHGMVGQLEKQVATVQTEVGKIRRENQTARTGTQVSESEAKRVFGLLEKLDDGDQARKAPLGAVFRQLVLQGQTQQDAAAKLGCSPALISARVKQLEQRMGHPLERLRALVTQAREVEMPVEDARARSIHRRGLTDDTAAEGDEAGY